MKYRVLGRTGFRVSELGVGGHEYRRPLPTTLGRWGEIDEEAFLRHQPERNRLIQRAIEHGINFFDATQREEARSLGSALKKIGAREKVHAALMILRPLSRMAEIPGNEWRRFILDEVTEKLTLLQADYLDLLNLHMPERGFTRERLTNILKNLTELKEQGMLRAIGASSHDPRVLAEIIRKYDCFDSVMIRYNYHLQEARDALFPLCTALNMGVVVMKPLAWPHYGIPFMRFGPVDKAGAYTPAQMSLRWILNTPEVTTVVPGINTYGELTENIGALAEGEVDEKVLAQYLEIASSPAARAHLEKMLQDPAIDIRYFAKRALHNLHS